jgi:hypothetical protein
MRKRAGCLICVLYTTGATDSVSVWHRVSKSPVQVHAPSWGRRGEMRERACLICMPYTYALHVCLTCMPYVYALYVCLTCMPGVGEVKQETMHALYVCLICMPCMYALCRGGETREHACVMRCIYVDRTYWDGMYTISIR